MLSCSPKVQGLVPLASFHPQHSWLCWQVPVVTPSFHIRNIPRKIKRYDIVTKLSKPSFFACKHLQALDEQTTSSRPPLPPKGDIGGPIAPPRKGIRKGSIPDSPGALGGRTSSSQASFRSNTMTTNPINGLSKSSTLPRKMGPLNNEQPTSLMAGRPLPPPPVVPNDQATPGKESFCDNKIIKLLLVQAIISTNCLLFKLGII